MTGGRVKRVQNYLKDERFMLTYGDGLANIDIKELLLFHQEHGKAITMTAVQPDGRFGALELGECNKVINFKEKPKGDGSWINGGFFVCEPKIFKYLTEGDQTVWERKPLEDMAKDGELVAYKHYGFWKPMDMLRDKMQLDDLWTKGNAPWKLWK